MGTVEKYAVGERQNFFDLALQHCGDVSAVFAMALQNGLSVTDALAPAQPVSLTGPVNADVVFLDIQFEREGKTCFDLLEKFKNDKRYNFQIIIITAHFERQYYAKAFEYKAIHFLEKPLNKIKLSEAIDRVKETVIDYKLNSLASLFQSELGAFKSDAKSKKISIERVLFSEIVDVNEILWIEADGRKSNVYLHNGRKIISTDNLGVLEKKLEKPGKFIRINRSEIINIEYVSRYSKKERMAVLNGTANKFFISKEVFPVFLSKLKN